MSAGRGPKRKSPADNLPRLSKEPLEEEELVEEATFEAYNESEQAQGFFTRMEDNFKSSLQHWRTSCDMQDSG
jgi:hypothetical protein